jgi:hypothetical protein
MLVTSEAMLFEFIKFTKSRQTHTKFWWIILKTKAQMGWWTRFF